MKKDSIKKGDSSIVNKKNVTYKYKTPFSLIKSKSKQDIYKKINNQKNTEDLLVFIVDL